ncbi:MAG: hypothetical protein HRT44_07760 [Bdellovibrionales bacterium]|nr:hypothetical protein [Bdellovibrionales bacterium]NQZ19134.1 hypothetical protein [Bdellovibrionales bacterium]
MAKIKYSIDYLGFSKSPKNSKLIKTSKDDPVSLSGFLTPYAFSLMLKNNSQQPLAIIWDETVYVDSRGRSHPLFHEAIDYVNAKKSHEPQTVSPQQSYNTTLTRSDNIHFVEKNYIGWSGGEIFPLKMIGNAYKNKKPGLNADQKLEAYLEENLILKKNHYLKVVLRQNKLKKAYYLAFKVTKAYLDK